MNHARALLLAAVLACVPHVGRAGTVETRKEVGVTVIAAGTTLASTRYTEWRDTQQYAAMCFDIALTAQSGCSTVTMACYSSQVSTTANGSGYRIQSLSVASGTATSTDLTFSNAVSGTESWTWCVDFIPGAFINCGFTGASCGASDVFNVVARGITP